MLVTIHIYIVRRAGGRVPGAAPFASKGAVFDFTSRSKPRPEPHTDSPHYLGHRR